MYKFQTQKSFHFQPKYYQRKFSVESTDDEKSVEKFCQEVHETSKVKYKTQLCKNYSENGFCRYGKKCRFAHGSNDLKITQDTKNEHYRTKKCQSFWVLGECSYGARCQFSHSEFRENKEILSICKKAICDAQGDASCSRLFTILG